MRKENSLIGLILIIALCAPTAVWAEINVGGALRVQYNSKDWSESDKDKGGDFTFDTFRLNTDGTVGDMILSAEYRFYPQDDWHGIHHGYIGCDFTENWQGQIGVHQAPFGIQPYASHNFWFSGAYYVGLEDDYDMGLKALYSRGPWDLALAFYKNAELGNPGNANRYSVDVLTQEDDPAETGEDTGKYANEEINQGNIRIAYKFDHGSDWNTEFGLSGQYGGIYNTKTKKTGDHWAAAAHIVGNYGSWNIQLQAAQYEYDPENPEGSDNEVMRVGAYSYKWSIPAEAFIGIFNIAYTMPVNIGPINSLTFYSDNTIIEPENSDWDTTWQNVVGCMIAAGPVYTYVDVISAENMTFMGGSMVDNRDEWQSSNNRNTRININVGYYF